MPDVPPEPPQIPRSATLGEVIATVFSSFLGIRKRAAMQRDAGTIRPHQVIIVAIVFAAIFVLALLTVVHFVAAP